ncbi:MAG: thioredoxin-disulfide reductase [Endomicrobiaceae bacterium]|nr:thioredoxin-disulfide reductase [Endomicrobiaceae bacterium]
MGSGYKIFVGKINYKGWAKNKMIYDTIIIGGGPAGLSSAIYSSRARLNTLIIEKAGCGGLIAMTDFLENYPGFESGINGFELTSKMEQQARNFGTKIVYGEVLSIETKETLKKVILADKTYITKTIIVASGSNFKKLGVRGEVEFIGKGVSYCATCDGPFFKNKEVAVIGGGDSALQEALFLTKFVNKVFLVHRRDKFRATQILQERVLGEPKIEVVFDSIVEEITGSEFVEKVKIKNVKSNMVKEIALNGVFIFIGWTPNTNFLTQNKITLDEKGYIVTDDQMKTSMDGIFACGDVRKKILRQVVTAAGDGAVASISAQKHIESD